MGYLLGGIVLVFIIIIFACLKIVPQSNEFVIERLGKYKATWGAGVHLKAPFIDTVANRVTIKEQVLDTPPQPVITADNVTMQIDAVVYFKIFDSQLYTYGVVNPINALGNLTATTLRNIVGDMTLDQSLTSRDTINGKMENILDVETDPWGIKVIRVEIKNIMPPQDIKNAMEKQMKAEREKREILLQAEAHKQAAITRAEGDKAAQILAAEGDRDARIARAEGEAKAKLLEREAEAAGLKLIKEAGADGAVLELKKYDALVKMADGKAVKIVIPTEIVDTAKKNILFSELTELGAFTAAAADVPKEVKPDPCCDNWNTEGE